VRPGDRLQIHEFHPKFSWKESGDSGGVPAGALSYRVLFFMKTVVLIFKKFKS
jgi:hypothetical protein